MSRLTELHSIFRKNSNYGANIGFHTLTFVRSLGRWRCLKPRTTDIMVKEGHLISQLYMDEVLRSVVLPFCPKTSDSTRPRMTMSEHTSLESANKNDCAFTGHFAHQTCQQFYHVYNIFGQRDQRIIMASRNPQPVDAVLQEILMLIPIAPNHKNYSEYVKPVLVLICQ